MAEPWEGIIPQGTGILKAALGDIFKFLDESEPFIQEILRDLAREHYLVAIAKTQEEKDLHEQLIRSNLNTAAARGIKRGIQFADKYMALGEDFGKMILNAAFNTASGFLRGWIKSIIPIP